MVYCTNILRGSLALVTVVTSMLLVFGIINSPHQAHAEPARAMKTTINEYKLPSGNIDPWGTAVDSKGHVWVAVPGCDPSPMCAPSTPPGRLAVFNPATRQWIGVHHLPTGYAQPLFLAFDRQGMLWFALPMGNAIGRYNPTSKTFQQWTVPTPGAGPWDVAIDANGYVWFTEHYTNKIGRFNPLNHTFMEVKTPAPNSQPYGITVDGADNVWFTENNSAVALIAEYTMQGSLLEYKIRNNYDGGLTPHLIAVDRQGNVWWTEGFVGMLGRLQVRLAQPGTNNGVKEYAYPSVSGCGGVHTSGIGVDGNGLIWFDDSLQCTVGNLNSVTGTFKLYSTPSGGSHPHDGLMVDPANVVWFDEEFTNKLGQVFP